MSDRNRSTSHGQFVSIVGILTLVFSAVPLVVTILLSFSPSSNFEVRFTGLTDHWYRQFLNDPTLKDALKTSLLISLPVTALSILVGVIAAYGFHYSNFRGKQLMELIIIVPGVMPSLLLGIGMSIMFNYVALPSTLLPTILGESTLYLPFAFFLCLMGLRGLNPNTERAALDLGAGPFTIFRRLTLPAIMPWILGAAMIIFPLSFNEIVFTTFMLNRGTTLPIYLYSALRDGVTPEFAAVAGFLVLSTLAIAVVLLAIISNLVRRAPSEPAGVQQHS